MKRFFDPIRKISPRQALAIAFAVIVINAMLYLPPVYRLAGGNTVLWLNNLTNIAAALISAWFGYHLFRSFHRGENQRVIWAFLLAGLVLWMIAEIAWDSDQLIFGDLLPSASLADGAWILGYVAVVIGLVLSMRAFRMRPSKPWQFAVLAVFGVVVIMAATYLIIPALNQTQAGFSYKTIVDLAYPLGDLVMGFIALVLVLVLDGGMLSRPWTTVAMGCFCIAVSDLLYAFALSRGIYQVDPPDGLNLISYIVNVSYTLAYVLLALGVYLQARLLDAV